MADPAPVAQTFFMDPSEFGCHLLVDTATPAGSADRCARVLIGCARRVAACTGIEQNCKLDAIVTVVDAKHIIQHLDEEKPEGAENEAVEQLVFADKVLLNKADLVEEAYLGEVEKRILDINKNVAITRCVNAEVPIETVLGIGAFSLEEVMKIEPDFLDPDECAPSLSPRPPPSFLLPFLLFLY